ncbi:ECF transporter S component [Geosporobacter ferrireducens]|uniref:ECF transporter S component n=1 Tax=Geosporobacter ferrireducens TaxID=1424294 RepID=A0A1D8GJI8_9FIRM|nr:ECF transporter S component [Geosporobacter ferrireducens]AOT71087.1 ECF transporter S component [Geosporobacter ferrireducens]MTI58232.1 ECF transporter S component [Geosporobacter ferrireducens]
MERVANNGLSLSLKQITVAGLLGAVAIALSMTPLGYIPIPWLANVNATTMHIPVIIASIVSGPLVGTMVGAIFGVSSFLRANNPFFMNPVVAILPRLLIGFTSYYAYKWTKSSLAAAVVGTLTNTIGVLSLVFAFGYLPLNVVLGIAGVNGTTEVIVSSLIVVAVAKSLKKVMR